MCRSRLQINGTKNHWRRRSGAAGKHEMASPRVFDLCGLCDLARVILNSHLYTGDYLPVDKEVYCENEPDKNDLAEAQSPLRTDKYKI